VRAPAGSPAADAQVVRRHTTSKGEALRLAILGFAALSQFATAACAVGVPDSACPPPYQQATSVAPDQLARLAGEYRLTLVNTRGEYGDSVIRGTLRLWPNDSGRRSAWVRPTFGRIRGERPLAGEFTSHSSTVPSYPNEWEPASPDRPAVELIGHTIYLGGIDAMDGAGERLLIRAVAASGFTGTWEHDGGIARVMDTVTKRFLEDPGGHFCASRMG
jgi:hypothetical protein